VAVADGDNAFARARDGDNNLSTATGAGSYVDAFGDNSRAAAYGEEAYAAVGVGSNNSATASGDNAYAHAFNGDNNSATADGDGAIAEAFFGNNNRATSTGIYTCAGNGDSDETAVNEDLCSN
jgi:hypothetical protein